LHGFNMETGGSRLYKGDEDEMPGLLFDPTHRLGGDNRLTWYGLQGTRERRRETLRLRVDLFREVERRRALRLRVALRDFLFERGIFYLI
jgi:hypothetical protein